MKNWRSMLENTCLIMGPWYEANSSRILFAAVILSISTTNEFLLRCLSLIRSPFAKARSYHQTREKSMICRMNFNQVHSQTTSLAYISASEEVLQKNFHHMFCYDIEMTSSFLHFTWLQVHKQVKFSCIQFFTTKKNLPCSLILLNYISWKMDLGYLKNGMVWMVYSHFLHKRSQSKLYNPNTDVKTKSHFSKRYEREK